MQLKKKLSAFYLEMKPNGRLWWNWTEFQNQCKFVSRWLKSFLTLEKNCNFTDTVFYIKNLSVST